MLCKQPSEPSHWASQITLSILLYALISYEDYTDEIKYIPGGDESLEMRQQNCLVSSGFEGRVLYLTLSLIVAHCANLSQPRTEMERSENACSLH